MDPEAAPIPLTLCHSHRRPGPDHTRRFTLGIKHPHGLDSVRGEVSILKSEVETWPSSLPMQLPSHTGMRDQWPYPRSSPDPHCLLSRLRATPLMSPYLPSPLPTVPPAGKVPPAHAHHHLRRGGRVPAGGCALRGRRGVLPVLPAPGARLPLTRPACSCLRDPRRCDTGRPARGERRRREATSTAFHANMNGGTRQHGDQSPFLSKPVYRMLIIM